MSEIAAAETDGLDAERRTSPLELLWDLVGHVAFRLRLGTVGYEKAIVAVALLVLYGLGSGLPAWAVAGAIAALLAVLCAIETTVDRRARAEEPNQPVHAYTGSPL